MEKQCKKHGIGKCKSERGTHDNCRKNGKAKCKLKRDKNCKWRKHRKSKCNLERGALTNEEYMEGTNASWKEATSYVENIER